MIIVFLVLALVVVIGFWKVFKKAGKPGWAAIVPIYNYVVLLQITGLSVWWILILLIPYVNIILMIVIYYRLAKAFGASVWYTVGMILLPFIFIPMLGFGEKTYDKTRLTKTAAVMPAEEDALTTAPENSSGQQQI